MNSHTDNNELIDRKTSRSICEAVGERLQQHIRPLESELPSDLAHLMDELRKRDAGGHRMLPNQAHFGISRRPAGNSRN